jgi:hypothetical protein
VCTKLGIEPEDVHGPSRIVLQRQFFEAVVRAAYVKYANKADLPTLADKLEYLFKQKLTPNAGKTKAKSVDEEVSYIFKLMLLSACRNNSRSLKRPLKSTPNSKLCSSTLVVVSLSLACKSTAP